MQIEPLVSVIIPAFNCERYISRAVRSVLSGSLESIEVIAVDDASADATPLILQGIAKEDPRLRVFLNKENKGVAVSRNIAISQSRGKWIALLDADDWYAPQRLERLLGEAERYHADAVADDQVLIRGQGEEIVGSTYAYHGLSIDSTTHATAVDLMRLQLLGIKPVMKRGLVVEQKVEFPAFLKGGEDYHLFLNLLTRGMKLILVPDAYYYYRKHSHSITANFGLMKEETLKMLNSLLLEDHIKRQDGIASAIKRLIKQEQLEGTFWTLKELFKSHHYMKLIARILANPELAHQIPVLWLRSYRSNKRLAVSRCGLPRPSVPSGTPSLNIPIRRNNLLV